MHKIKRPVVRHFYRRRWSFKVSRGRYFWKQRLVKNLKHIRNFHFYHTKLSNKFWKEIHKKF